MATPLSRKQLQELKAVREEEARRATVLREKELWETHVEDSANYIYGLIIKTAEQGDCKVTIHNFNTYAPKMIENQHDVHKHNPRAIIAHRALHIGSNVSCHDGSSISVVCLPDIMEQLATLFPDSHIELELPTTKNGGRKTLVIDWSMAA